ncbi:MAG: carbonic anhydrase [Sulfurimonas sp.]|jgi:carbonic anhydrase|nr:carbonic anhydrase [Sulfurimonadaceae bacterium]
MDYNELIKGNEEFQQSYFKKHEQKLLELSENGQNPKILYISCSDSRVIPGLITKTAPGDLFVVRNVGNLVAPYSPDEDFHSTASSIEYAISVLGIESIIVCGHTHCGAIEAVFHKDELLKPELVHTRKWLSLAERPKAQAVLALGNDANQDELYRLTEKLSVIAQLENLLTYPAVRSGVKSGQITLHGWIYDIKTGEISYYNPEISQFEPICNLAKEIGSDACCLNT